MTSFSIGDQVPVEALITAVPSGQKTSKSAIPIRVKMAGSRTEEDSPLNLRTVDAPMKRTFAMKRLLAGISLLHF
jgi:hypothetical protein